MHDHKGRPLITVTLESVEQREAEIEELRVENARLREKLDYVIQALAPLVVDNNRPVEALARHVVDQLIKMERKLVYAEDAAAKGDLARQTAGGMEMEIAELKERLAEAERLLREARRGVQYLIGSRSLLNEIDAFLRPTASAAAEGGGEGT